MGEEVELPNSYWQKCGNFRSFPQLLRFCLKLLKVEAVENFKNAQQSYFISFQPYNL
jgi:hypothetical protein